MFSRITFSNVFVKFAKQNFPSVRIFFLRNHELSVCTFWHNCKSFPCKDSNQGHRKDNKLGKLFTKGPEYHEPRKIGLDQARENICNGIENFVSAGSQKNTK